MKILPRKFIVNNLLLLVLMAFNEHQACFALDTKIKDVPPVEKQSLPKSNSSVGTEILVGDYKIKMPAYFVFKRHDKKGSENIYFWETASSALKKPNQTLLIVQITPFCSVSESQSEFVLNLIYRAYIWGMSLSSGLSNFQQAEPFNIAINKFSFIKGGWSGIKKDNQLRLYGISYVTVASGNLIGIHGMSTERSLLKRVEEAVQTFHR